MRFYVSLFCATMAYWGLSPAALSREPALAALVPANAIVCLTTPDLAQLDSHWAATGFCRLWQDDALRDFRISFHRATRLTPDADQSLLGVSWQQLLERASGEACWALVPISESDAGFLLLVDVSQHMAEATQTVAELRGQSSTADGRDRQYFLEAGVLGISNRHELAGKALEWLKNPPQENLLASAAYRTVAEQCQVATGKPPAQLNWYIQPWAFQALVARAGFQGVGKTWNQLAAEGFQVIQAAGGVINLATAEHDLEHRWLVFAPGERKNAARLLDFSPLADFVLPTWVPADIDAVLDVHWKLAGALTGYGSHFDATYAEGIKGTFEAVLADIHQEPDGPQVDIRSLVNLQAGPVLSLTKTLSDGKTAVVYAVKVSDEPQMARSLQRMFETDEGVHRKTVGKYEMWEFAGSSATDTDEVALGPNLAECALCVAEDYFFVATSATDLESLLSDPPSAKLNDEKSYQALQTQAAATRSQHTIGWHIAPVAAGVRPLYEELRTAGTADLGQLLGEAPSDNHRVDLSRLPTGAVLPGFIAASWGLIDQVDDGWLMRGSILKHVE